ncbi:MAG: L-threonylcarbamoyladenylate synthase [Saprospiraceae bacterium]
MLLEIHPKNPDLRKIRQTVEALLKGETIVYPTDTVYGLGCDMNQKAGIDKMCQIKKVDPDKALFTLVCNNISQIAEFTAPIDNETFRWMKRLLPGPFTFILKPGNHLPKALKNRKQTIGVRIPDNQIVSAIIDLLGRPLLSSSLKSEDDFLEYITDPTEIYDIYGNQVGLVIDGGMGGLEPSTIIDCTGDNPEILRQGKGIVSY